MKKTVSALTATLLAASALHAAPEKKVESATTFGEIFTKGTFDGRLRSNTFMWDWEVEKTDTQIDNHAWGLGGSAIFKTAPMAGISATVGAFYSNASLYSMDKSEVSYIKAGVDVMPRLAVENDNDYDMLVLALAHIQAQAGQTKLTAGRQIINTVFTNANDTKMIPNTFEAVVLENKDIKGTTIRLIHINKQKLRSHTQFHDVITFKDASGESWNNNDDSAAHKGLTYTNFKEAGKDTRHTLSIATVKSTIGENLNTEISYLTVPDVVSNLTLEAHYTLKAGTTKIIPGFRYMMQKDDGGGAIGGASLTGNVNATALRGYKVGNSLDSSLVAARLNIVPEGNLKYSVGYSKIADEADIVAPWRGFPTGGFTRAMAQYNWVANTTSYAARVDAKITKDITMMAQYAMQDFDEAKTDAQADLNILHVDAMFKLDTVAKGLELKLRTGIADGEVKGTKPDNSYKEYRVELNYLF